MSDLNLCYGCMEPLGSDSVCAHCGYDQNTTSLANYLKPGTKLRERFLVGRVLSANGEGVTYIGFDTSVECKVLIREYFPERLCSRVPNSAAVNVKYDRLAQYKALMAEYTELNKALARLRTLSHLNPALDMFAENNTTYAVYEYLEGGTLLDYLKENAGELSWNTVRRIFPPLFTTLSLLHNAGVLHRGLSPETIFVTDKGELKLLGFSISAVRTNDTELDAELFDGYAAPEQYFADRQQGTWTDVYGICAVLYRILTGCRATDAISRQDYDILVPPNELNPQVPENVSDGIMQGLKLDSNARIRTVSDLVALLFEEELPEQSRVSDLPAGAPDKEATAVFKAHQSYGSRTADSRTGHTGQHSTQSGHTGQHSTHSGHTGQQSTHSGHTGQHRRPAGQGSGARPQHSGTGQKRPANGQHRPNPNGQHRSPQQRSSAAGRSGANRSAAQRSHTQGRPQNGRRPSSAARGRYNAKNNELTVFERIRTPLLIAFLFIAIVTIVVVALTKILRLNTQGVAENSQESSYTEAIPTESSDSDEHKKDFEVPNLIGMNYQIKKDELAKDNMLVLEAEFEFNEHLAKDQIFWQEFEKGEAVASGSTMKVKVSLGSSIITIPPFKGLRLQSYCKKLEEMGLSKAIDGGGNNNMGTGSVTAGTTPNTPQIGNDIVTTISKYGKVQNVIYRSTVNFAYQNGYVCSVEPDVGTLVDALDDYDIIVYYAYNPVYDTVANGSVFTTSNNGKKTTKTTKTTAKTTYSEAKTTAGQQQTAPPATQQTDPPATVPPATNPPAPVTDPPVQQPAVSDPPAPPPPTTDAPVNPPPSNGGDPPADG